ncbi:hypothetical protein ABIF66_009514 [Bradyrhizobium japonicum]
MIGRWTEPTRGIFAENYARNRSREPCSSRGPGAEESRRFSCLAEGIRWLHREVSRGAEDKRFRRRRRYDTIAVHERQRNSRRRQFRAKTYPTSFTPKNRACIQRGKAVYDRDQENNDNYFVFCGELIFVFTKTPAGFLFTDVGAND